MENSKDYNFFYIREKTEPARIIITASLGEGKYSDNEINESIEMIKQQNGSLNVVLYKDDGENLWKISETGSEKLDIGTKEDSYSLWSSIKERLLEIPLADILVICNKAQTKESEQRVKIRMK